MPTTSGGTSTTNSDSAPVYVSPPPPPPPPPHISLNASATTVSYNAEHVTITASVWPSGYGYETALQWTGGYAVQGNNLQRKVSTAQHGTFPVQAYIPNTAAQDAVHIEVQPYVILTPATALTYVGFNPEVIIAEVGPPEAVGQLQWSTDPAGAGQVDPSDASQFLVSTAQAGVVHVYASLGVGQQQSQSTVVIQHAPACTIALEAVGTVPSMTYRYRFISSPGLLWSEQIPNRAAVETAFARWTSANQASGLQTMYAEQTQPGGDREIELEIHPAEMLPPNTVAYIDREMFDFSGHLIKAAIVFTNSSNLLAGPTGFLKAALHEIGHVHGLADNPSAAQRSTVMFTPPLSPSWHDELPEHPSPCDREQAFQASH